MLKVYYLPVERIDNTDRVKGSEHIHHAILECTDKADVRKLIMDTTPEGDSALTALAIEVREPIEQERTNFEALPEPAPSARVLEQELDELKARVEILERSMKVV